MIVWIRTLQLGFKSLLLHPLRSLLTVLGIFIGVASVIWLLAIGEGISKKAQEQIEGLGADNIIVRSIKPPNEALPNIRGPIPYGLKRDDFQKLLVTIPSVKKAIPIRELKREFRRGDKLLDGRLVGCTPEYAELTRLVVDRGRFLEKSDIDTEANFCVLAAEVADRLFPLENPLEDEFGRPRQVRVAEDYYTIIGVMKPRGATAAIGGSLAAQDFTSDVYVPITTVWRRIGDTVVTRGRGTFEGEIVELSQITLRVDSVDNVLATSEVVAASLRNHDDKRDIALVVPLELLEQARTTRMMFMIFMGLIAAISLVVGGIGIMNIMLATVTERTREIGIRRALGAKRADIIRQFLVETIALSTLGGLTGVVGGLACLPLVEAIRSLIEANAPETIAAMPEVIRTVRPIIVPVSIPLAFGISLLVGVVFGLYPAVCAAEMDPIEALRHT